MLTLDQLWDRLGSVSSLSFVARSGRPGGWNGAGNGTVVVARPEPASMTFTESGFWRPEGGRDIRFHNVFRWSATGATIRLEHLRFGVEHPVYLFELAQAGEREWRSVSPHQCQEDCYAAILIVDNDRIILRWSIDGPWKQETVEYAYVSGEAAGRSERNSR